MARDFNLDTNAAKEANNGGKRITDVGVYVGTFRAAWYEKNDKGTESVQLIFVSDAGQEAGPLALYTHNGAGDELPSNKMLHAILASMKVRGVKAQPGKVTLWDYDTKSEVEKTKETYPAMMGPTIGLVLTDEEYRNRNGDVKTRLQIGMAFNSETRQSAAEVLGSETATALDNYTAYLDKTGRWHKPINGSHAPSQAANAPTFDDDDIPF